MEKNNTANCKTFTYILNANFLKLIEKLKNMRINYNKSKARQFCYNDYDFFVIWMKMFIKLNKEDNLKIINSERDVIINKRSEKFLNEFDVMNQNVFKQADVVWPYMKFTEEFINSFSEDKNKEQILKTMLSILLGYFEDLKIAYLNTDNKLIVAFSSNLSKDSNLYFSLYFENLIDENSDCFEIIKFIGIFKNDNEFIKVFNVFNEEFINDNSVYPLLDFDKLGTKDPLSYEIFIFHKKPIMHNKEEIFLNLPHSPFPPQCKIEKKKIKLFSKEYTANEILIDNLNFQEFVLGEKNEKVFNFIDNCDTKHKILLELIEQEEFKNSLSDDEKKLILERKNIIISGRSGTGKTTIIVYKILFSFINFYLFKNQVDFKELSLKDIFLPTQFEKEKLKYVFTSYSQSLCKKVEEMYSDLINALCKKEKIPYKHTMTKYDLIKKVNSFREIENFPLFVNFRKILFLIDGTLNTQFFQRIIQNKMIKEEEECDIKFSHKCKYRLNHYIISNALNFDVKTYFLRAPLLKDDNSIIKQEINENDFTEIFFEKVLCRNLVKSSKQFNLSPSLIFSQIHSVIKGSTFSHLSYMNCISRNEYINVTAKLTDLTEEQKQVVYEIFKEYEIWKWDKNYFDLQDLVNHLIRQVKIELLFKEDIKLIDYFFIDEVQDLTMNQIYLLTLITRYPLAYAGDTCQTVSKSIRFRFTDLLQIFHTFTEIIDNYQKPLPKPLNQNFRFGANILKISNFVTNLIFEIFPKSIDKFNYEYTFNKKDTFPFTLNNIDSLINLMSNDVNFDYNFFAFASFHCVICRSQEIVNDLKQKYKSLKIKDINSSKGLEFEIVLIYNFFKDSNCKKFWIEVLNSIEIIEKPNEYIEDIKNKLKKTKELNEKEIIQILKTLKTLYYPKLTKELNTLLYFDFCTELKQLYVAMTRARTFLIFYDEDLEVYPLFIKRMQEINLITKDRDYSLLDKVSSYIKFNSKKVDAKTLEKEGDEYFRLKNYDIAEYYYDLIKNNAKAKKAKAYQIFQKILLMERDKKENYVELNELVISILKDIECQDDTYGECLINLGEYKEALNLFEQRQNLKKCGKICMEFLEDYNKAFDYYDKINEIFFAIAALIKGKEFEKLFTYIRNKKNNLDLYNVVNLYKKYSHYYLNKFVIKLTHFVPKIKTISNIKEKKINPEPLVFMLNENCPLSQIQKLSLDETRHVVNTEIKDPFKIKNNNSYFHTKSSYLLSNSEKQKNYDLTRNSEIQKTNNEKAMRLFNFIHQYISIVQEKSKTLNLNTDFDDFLDAKLNKIISENIEIIKFYPNQCNTILKSISEFDNYETLKVLYSIFICANTKEIFKEIQLKTQINFWKRNEENSPENLFTNMKKLNKIDVHNFILKNKENLREISNETLIRILNIIRLFNLTEDESVKLLKKLLFMNGNFESLITIAEPPFNFYLSCVTSNFKLFNRIIANQSFVNSYQNLEAFWLTSFLRLNICKFFSYLNKWRIMNPNLEEKQKLIKSKIQFCLNNLFCYVEIYEIIEKILNHFGFIFEQVKTRQRGTTPIISNIKEYRSFLESPEESLSSKNQILKLIEIGTTLSIFFYFYGGSKFESFFKFDTYEEQTFYLSECFQEIKYFISNLRFFSTKYFKPQNEDKNNNYYIIRLIFFSLFNVFNVTIFPQEKIFKSVYGNLPILVMNTNSVLFSDKENFKEVAEKILQLEQTKNFDSKGENFIINYNSIYDAFFKLISKLLLDVSVKFKTLIKEPWFDECPVSRLNDVIKCYSFFFDYYLIQESQKSNTNTFVNDFHSKFYFLINNKMNMKFFQPYSFQILYEKYNNNNNECILSKILNIEFTIYLSFMPLINSNKYLNERSVEFADLFFNILFKSIEKYLNSSALKSFEDKYIKYMINFYFMNFLFCGCKQNLFIFNITEKTEDIKNFDSALLNINEELTQGYYLDFCIESVKFINEYKKHFSALMLIIWVKKLSFFIYLLINFFIHPEYSKFSFSIFSNDFIDEEITFISELKRQLNSEAYYNLEFKIKDSLNFYFDILEYFLDTYMTEDNEEKEEENEGKSKFYFSPILNQFFELEIYKIYLTLNNNIINLGESSDNESFTFLEEKIKKFSDSYIKLCYFKGNFEYDQKVDFNTESIKFYFEYFSKKEYYKSGFIIKREIKTNDDEEITFSCNKIQDQRILEYLENKNSVFELNPKDSKEVDSYNFIYSSRINLNLNEYVDLIEKIYPIDY